jgi:hypothetical protein
MEGRAEMTVGFSSRILSSSQGMVLSLFSRGGAGVKVCKVEEE